MATSTASTTSRLILRPITDTLSSTASAAVSSTTSAVAATITYTPQKKEGNVNAAVVAGGVIGGLIGLGIIAILILECFIRKRYVLLQRGSASIAPTTDTALVTTLDVFGNSSQGTTAVGSRGDDTDNRRVSQASKTSGGSGQKVRFESSQTVTSVV